MSLPAEFRALVVSKSASGIEAKLEALAMRELPAGDVLIQVAFSSLNYKDALAATGNPGIVKKFPHVPGVDAAGVVAASNSPDWQPGQGVLVTGFDLGANHWGGYAEFIRVPAHWVVRLPRGLTLRESMILGTAGFTAGQSVRALITHGIEPSGGEVVVTGASGGVGSVAVAILARLGYNVTAVSGKPTAHEFLKSLGAKQIVSRDEVDDRSGKPLLAARWSGSVDTVGGNTLSTILRATKTRGCVTACGLVGGNELQLTVFPFILRGVSLVGIDSVSCPMAERLDIWSHLADDWKPARLEAIATEIGLEDLAHYVQEILAGHITGRVIVRPK